MPKPPAVEDLPPFQYCMYNKNQMIYASSHRFFQHYSVVVKKSRHEKYLFLICFFKSRHEEHFCGSCFFKSGHGQ